MKLKLLLSILFIIATSFTALHEVEHLKNHDSSSCQICIVDDHLTSATIVNEFKEDIIIFDCDDISSQTIILTAYHKNHSYQTRAPPFHS